MQPLRLAQKIKQLQQIQQIRQICTANMQINGDKAITADTNSRAGSAWGELLQQI